MILQHPPESPREDNSLPGVCPELDAVFSCILGELREPDVDLGAEALAENLFTRHFHEEPVLVALIILLWADLCERKEKEQQCLMLLKYASDMLSTQKSPPLLSAYQAYLSFMLRGFWPEISDAKDACHHAMDLAPKGSWMWVKSALHLQHIRAYSDQGYSIEREPDGLLESLHDEGRYELYTARLFGLTVSGHLDLAAQYLAPLRTLSRTVPPSDLQWFAVPRVLLHHMGSILGHPEQTQERYDQDLSFFEQQTGESVKGHFQTTQYLLAGDPEKALQSAKTYAASLGEIFHLLHRFDAYDLIRAELANGHADAVMSLLRKRHKNNLRIWLDDLYMARVCHLEGLHHEAEQRFLTCCKYAIDHDLKGQLIFELSMALDLPTATILKWRQLIDSPPNRIEAIFPETTPTLRAALHEPTGLTRIIGNSLGIQKVREQIRQLAPKTATVLITGETGTGKELAARAIHEESRRKHDPFISVNCGALSPSLLATELFGHSKGAFTGAVQKHDGLFKAAGTGSIFLDEIGELPLSMQAALLRVLDSGEITPVGSTTQLKISCRVITATNRDLRKEVRNGQFREDLFYRLSTFQVHIPPLRQRLDDLEPLTQYFLMMHRTDDTLPTFPRMILDQLRTHPWRGNIRELRNIIENIRLMQSEPIHYNPMNIRELLGPDSDTATVVHDTREKQTESASEENIPMGTSGPLARLSEKALKSPLRRRQRLKQLFQEFGQLYCREVVELLNVSRAIVTSDMKALRAEGYIRKVMPNRSPNSHYYEWIQDHTPESSN